MLFSSLLVDKTETLHETHLGETSSLALSPGCYVTQRIFVQSPEPHAHSARKTCAAPSPLGLHIQGCTALSLLSLKSIVL